MAAVATPERPTRVRCVVVASASLMAVLLYLDRFCISFAEVYIQEDLGLTNAEVGWMLSAFFWTYALGQVPAGWLSDRFGSRLMLTLYVLSWSLLTALTGLASGFVMLLALRIGFGFAQAGAYPTASGIVSRWIPFAERGRASSLIALGGQLGGFLALLASGYLLVLLTPLSTPTRLETDDILNGSLISHQLQSASESDDPLNVVLQQFTSAGRALVQQQAAAYAAAQTAVQERRGAKSDTRRAAVVDVAPLTVDERQSLADEFNAIIATPEFFTLDEVAGLSVEKETRRLLSRAERLDNRQWERINRLVLEGLHREGLRKLYGAGWRPLMFFYGSLGIFVAGLIWWNCRTDPAEHPQINAAERRLISGLTVTRPMPKLSRIPLRELVTSGSMWCSCLSQWFTNIGWVFLMTWAPRYYSSVHELPIEKRALLVSIPPLFGWAGMLVGGAVTDRAATTLGLRWGRALPISLSRFLAMAAYIGCLFEPGPYVAAGLFSVVAFATSLGTAPGWAFTQDVGGRHVGSVLGWGNMWGNLGAAVTPPFLIAIVGEAENWNNAFIVCAAAFFLSGVVALGINATIPIAPEEKPIDEEIPS